MFWWRQTNSSLGTWHIYYIEHNWWGCGLASLWRSLKLWPRETALGTFYTHSQHQYSSTRGWLCHSWTWRREDLTIPTGLRYWGPRHGRTHVNNTLFESSPQLLIHSVYLVLTYLCIMPFLLISGQDTEDCLWPDTPRTERNEKSPLPAFLPFYLYCPLFFYKSLYFFLGNRRLSLISIQWFDLWCQEFRVKN